MLVRLSRPAAACRPMNTVSAGVADALVVPGGMFGPAAGLLLYAGAVAEGRGATVHRLAWSQEPPNPFGPEIEGWVRAEVTRALDAVGGSPLLIGKSLGTYAAPLIAERCLPAVWITPVLTVPSVAAAIGRATAPCLLVVGTADAMWDGAAARRLTRYVLEIEGADHGMQLPGPLTESIAILGRVVVEIEGFLDAIDWPAEQRHTGIPPSNSLHRSSCTNGRGPVRSSRTGPLTCVGVTGFEPATSSSRTKRATKLRHTPMARGP
jgi:hypothetical protein